MKIKPLYIYLIAFVLVIVIIVIASNAGKETSQETTSENEMPQDELQKGMSPPTSDSPSGGNVSNQAKHQLEMLKKSYDENPTDTAKAKLYADMLVAAHSPEKALPVYNSIIEKDPTRIDILLGMTLANYKLKNWDECETLTNKILKIDKDNPEANYNLGAIEASKGNKEKARKIWEDLIKKYPKSDAARIANTSILRL